MSEAPRMCFRCGGTANLRTTPYKAVVACDIHYASVLVRLAEAVEDLREGYLQARTLEPRWNPFRGAS